MLPDPCETCCIEEDMSVGDLIEKMYNECYVRQSGKSMPKIGKTK
jgi:hypothetical protein